jgi:hypothetical protein
MGEDNTIDGLESTFAYIYTYITTQAKKKTPIQTKPNRDPKESCVEDTCMSIALLWGERVCNLIKFGGWDTCRFA